MTLAMRKLREISEFERENSRRMRVLKSADIPVN
jgi:hypothetical protein